MVPCWGCWRPQHPLDKGSGSGWESWESKPSQSGQPSPPACVEWPGTDPWGPAGPHPRAGRSSVGQENGVMGHPRLADGSPRLTSAGPAEAAEPQARRR